jgi:hypothetical protein
VGVLALPHVKAFNSEIPYLDPVYFDVYTDNETELYVDTYNLTTLNIGSTLKADVVVTITLPSDISFLESDYESISITQQYLIDENLANQPIYYIADLQKFTFNEMYYNLTIENNTLYLQGYNAGFLAGVAETDDINAQIIQDAIELGREQLWQNGSLYYGYKLGNSEDYVYGLFDAKDEVATDIYLNGFRDLYRYDGTTSVLDDETSYPYEQGYNAGIIVNNQEAYNVGYSDGSNDIFMSNFDKWIVPAILIIMFLGSFIAYAKFTNRGD